jgi:hypothetical protein
MAQVYSVNVVGYVNVTLPGLLFKGIGNPLNAPTNTLAALIPNAPNQSTFSKFNGVGFDIYTKVGPVILPPNGGWTLGGVAADTSMNVGEGGLFQANSTFTNTFVGEVLQGNLVNPFPAGLSIRASQVPQSADATVLGLTAAAPAQSLVLKVRADNSAPFYDTYTRGTNAIVFPTGWNPSPPVIDIAEAFFLNAQSAGSWNRSFTVGP